MITINGIQYLSKSEAREYLAINAKAWSMYHHRLPYEEIAGAKYVKLDDLVAIREKLDPTYYLTQSQILAKTGLYYLKFLKLVDQLNVPTYNHPFHSRLLYRVSDIAVLLKGRYGKP